eukprot:8044059-Pyramimonas_sp.AAC.1
MPLSRRPNACVDHRGSDILFLSTCGPGATAAPAVSALKLGVRPLVLPVSSVSGTITSPSPECCAIACGLLLDVSTDD